MNFNDQTEVDIPVEDDIKVDDNVDELFEQKMRQLRELGIGDDRMMQKVNLIRDLQNNTSKVPIPKSKALLRRQYQPLGRPQTQQEALVEFKGEQVNEALEDCGAQQFKPIEGSGLKWSLPISKRPRDNFKRQRSPSPESSNRRPYNERSRSPDRSDHNSYDVKPEVSTSGRSCGYNRNHKPKTVAKFDTVFENRRSKPVEEKTGTITDIEAFIRDCNKKAEKPKALILDDIDDYILKMENKFNEISAKLDKNY